MNPAAFLSELRRLGIDVRMDGEELRCRARAGALSAELLEALRQRRSDIERFLRSAQELASQQIAIVPLQRNGTSVPVFAVPGHNGDVFCYRALAESLGPDQPFFALQPPGLDGKSEPLDCVEDLAGYFADQMRAFRPRGPYIIAGYCAGGTVAFELAQQLLSGAGDSGFLALFGAPYPDFFRPLGRARYRLGRRCEALQRTARELARRSWHERARYIMGRLRRPRPPRPAVADPVQALRAKVERSTLNAVRAYSPSYFPGCIQLFVPSSEWAHSSFSGLNWKSVAGRIEVYFGPPGCTADNMLRVQYAPVFAELIRRSSERLRAAGELPYPS